MTELTTYPRAYAAWLRAAADHDGEEMTDEEIAAEVAHRVNTALGDTMTDFTWPPAATLVALMGGTDYVRACAAWGRNCAMHPRRRQSLPAPAVPGAVVTA